jgi:VWFA-related protein
VTRAARAIVGLVIAVLAASGGGAAQQATLDESTGTGAFHGASGTGVAAASLRITSPLGRTGLTGKIRIVAQLHAPPDTVLSPVQFYVDGVLVGTSTSGPPFAVDWDDADPLAAREIVAQATDGAGDVLKDTVHLPPFEAVFHRGTASVLVDTSVYDAKGRFAPDLEPSVFHLSENGVAQKIDLVDRQTLPATLVLLVDNSQSMSRRMEFVRHAAGRFGTGLYPQDKVVVAPFNQHVGTITGPTDDRPTIMTAIDEMRSSGGTAILDGLLEGVRMLDGVDGRRAIVLVTDGYDENSAGTLKEAIEAAQAAQVTVYPIAIGGVAGISLKGEEMLREIADRSGGRAFFPPRESDLASIADTISSDTHSRYLLAYTPSDQTDDGSWRQITVEVPEGYKVRARAGYFAPKPPPVRPAIEFTIMNAARQFVDVTAGDLDVLEDGVLQSVDAFQEVVDPVSIVMAVDASGSMKKSADAVREASREFVRSVRPEDSLALVMFADKVRFAHVLAADRDWSYQALDKYTPIGGTALYDAIWDSLRHLEDVKGRRAIVVLTDGRDENNPGTAPGSVHTLDDVVRLEKSVGATVFGIGLGTKVDRDVLVKLAEDSGGEAYFPADVSELAAQYDRVVENLRRRYVLGYASTNSERNGAWRRVEIQPHEAELTVTTRGGYFAPDKKDGDPKAPDTKASDSKEQEQEQERSR